MVRFVTIFFLPLLIANCLGEDSNGTNVLNDCGSENEGQEKKVLNGWATCHKGRHVMTACQADDGRKVEIGLTVHQRNFVFECAQTSSNADAPLSMRPVACLRQKGKSDSTVVVEADQRIRDPPFVYQCIRVPTSEPGGNSLTLKAVACSTNTTDIPDGGSVTLGSFTYNCSRASGSLTNTVREVFLQAKGCLYQGKEYPLDQTVIVGSFAFKCRSTGGWPSALEFAIVGCANEGRRYDENEKYYTPASGNGSYTRFVMQCKHTKDQWSAVPVGCLQEGNPPKEHPIGDTWTDDGGPGDARLKYVMTCRYEPTPSVRAVYSQCVYQPKVDDASTSVTINPGCMKNFTKPSALVKCIKPRDASEGVSSEVLYRLNLKKVEQDAMNAGFRYC